MTKVELDYIKSIIQSEKQLGHIPQDDWYKQGVNWTVQSILNKLNKLEEKYK